MSVKVTVPNTSSDSVVFGSANTPTAAEVVGIDSGSSNGQLAFKTTASGTSTERMRIDASGNVGIGTSSPTSKLSISTSAGEISNLNSTNASGSYVSISNAGTNYGFMGDASQLIGGAPTSSLGIRSQNNVIFSSGGFAERMRIDSSGNVLINATATVQSSKLLLSDSANTFNLFVIKDTGTTGGSYVVFANSANSVAGSITHNGTTTVSYNSSSDYRLKENIVPMTGALEKVSKLKPVTYTWKNTDNELGEGFIAHELAEVCPIAVTGKKDAVDAEGNPVYQGIDTSFLVATLTAAIQEQQELIKQLQADVATLKGTA